MKYEKPTLKTFNTSSGMICEAGTTALGSGCTVGVGVAGPGACGAGGAAAGDCYNGSTVGGTWCGLGSAPSSGISSCATGKIGRASCRERV